MTSHHGKRISFCDIAGIFGAAFLRTTTPDKEISGFRACRPWRLDEHIFQDDEFATAAMTEEGPWKVGQPDVATDANVEVHAVDEPIIASRGHLDNPAFRVVL